MPLLFHFAFQGRVEVVLDVVVGAPYQVLGYFRPPIPILVMELQYLVVLLICPFVFFYVWVQVIMPSFTTLLSDAAG